MSLPAYGKALIDKRRQGIVPENGRVFIFDGWPKKPPPPEFGWYAVVPRETAPELDYSFARGLDCIAVGQTMADAIVLGHCILPFKPKRLTLLCPSGHADMPWPK